MSTLVVGNTGYFTDKILKMAFPEDEVVICREGHEDRKVGDIRWLDVKVMDEKLDRVFDTYDFERVIYISKFVTKDNRGIGEVEELRQVFSLSQKAHVKQFVYITSDDAILDVTNSASIIFDSAEKLCDYYSHNYLIETKIVYIPYLISGTNKDDYWPNIFSMLEKGKDVEIHALPDETAYFLSMQDLANFILRLFENWNGARREGKDQLFETIYLKSGATTKYSEIGEVLEKYYPDARITFRRSRVKDSISYHRNKAREDYGWFSRVDACAGFADYIEEYRSTSHREPDLVESTVKRFKLDGPVAMIIELILGAVLVELYYLFASESVQLRMIDVRLLFVVLIATVYGTSMGTVAAFIETILLFYSNYKQGTTGLVIFYDAGNWIPYVLLFVTAAVCGYVKQKRDDDISFATEEIETLRSENESMSIMYRDAIEYKNQYRQELIGSRDGFGKIFDVVQKLSNTVPEKIFAESIPVMEEVLDNRSIAIYTINDKDARFARLIASSEPVNGMLKKSINLNSYREVIDTIREKDIWFNSAMTEDLPMYAAGIKADGDISVLIMVYRVDYVQISTYFANLIRILSGLMENFILKAWDYQRAVAESTYVDGTSITKTDYFKKQLEIHKEMAENRITTFSLFRILREDYSLDSLDEMFQYKIRNNDILGLGEDGNIYLLAVQVDETTKEIVLRRFLDMGLNCEPVENMA